MRVLPFLAVALFATSCDVIMQPAGMIPQWTAAWRDVVAPKDRERLSNWRKSFVEGLAAARKSGHSAEIAREGALLDPDAGLTGGQLANGTYRCRVIKLGAKSVGMLDYVSYPASPCRIRAERELQRLDKLGGSQRYVGLIFPNDAIRRVFLGTLILGDERRAMQYREDPDRDIAGFVERIGDNRWRLIMPRPQFESQIDVMELVPSGEGVR